MNVVLSTILITLGLLLVIIFAMSIGFMIKGRSIKGSCGGISSLGLEKVCDCEDACDSLKEKVEKGEVSEDELKRFDKSGQKQAIFHEVK